MMRPFAIVLLSMAASLPALAARRVAVVVGTNHAVPGREALRYADQDARDLADVLIRAGQFQAADVYTLIDPDPAVITGHLDRLLQESGRTREETLLLFYYSGHADDRALYPAGQALPLTDLRSRLGDSRAAVRIGIIDACRGGAWTRAKGLKAEPPFEVIVPLEVASEGSVLMSSSSGEESAHEADSLRGSFFTHHLVAGLRGAAASSNSGQVTLTEAFAYAQRYTVRDTSRMARDPQHPSFDMQLRGRTDIALTRTETSPTLVSLEQIEGPLQLVQLSTGVVVLEVPAGEKTLKLAVPAGTYLVRKLSGRRSWSREIQVEAGRPLVVSEASLELVSSTMLIAKGTSTSFTTASAGSVSAQLSAGISRSDSPAGPDLSFTHSSFVLHGSLEWGITDRLQLNLLAPGVAYRFGEPGDLEAVPHLFMAGFSLMGGSTGETTRLTFHYLLGADLVARKWVSFEGSLNAQITAFSSGVIGSPLESFGYDLGEPRKHGPNHWRVGGSLGWSQTFAGSLTVNLGIAASDAFAFGAMRGYADPEARLSFGSVQSVGGRPLSLLELHLSRALSLELHAWTSVGASTGSVESTVLAGVSKIF
jgi:hypothetical protein